ncbi:hypothetical protein K438DRAFT_1985581 [Mycena galopus ATCC 62051]|nr:hypothetical protein K438DRAFT_1985581 [Mycena galopus ATCC 62051]
MARAQQEVACCHRIMVEFFVLKIKQVVDGTLAEDRTGTVSSFRINGGALAAVQARVDDVWGQVGNVQALVDEVVVEFCGQVEHVHPRVDKVGSQVGHVRVDEIDGQVSTGNAATAQTMHNDNHSLTNIAQQLAEYHSQITVVSPVPDGLSDQTFIVLSPTDARIPISVAYCTSYEMGFVLCITPLSNFSCLL